MSEAKRRQEAERNEGSAVEILAEIRKVLKIPDSESVLLYIERKMMSLDDLVFGVRVRLNEKNEIIAKAYLVNPGYPRSILEQVHTRMNHRLSFEYMVRDAEEAERNRSNLIKPVDFPGNGRIIAEG